MHVRQSLLPFMRIGLFQKNSKEGVGWWYIYISKKNPWNLYICHFILRKKASPLEIPQICATPHGNSKTKNLRPMENPDDFFLITPRKFASSLIDSGISACFFQYPFKFHYLNTPFFFWNMVVITSFDNGLNTSRFWITNCQLDGS